MRRPVLAFTAGALVVFAVRNFAPSPHRNDPLPDRRAVEAGIHAAARQAPDSQRGALADGHVDQAEYRAAIGSRLQCVHDHLPEVDRQCAATLSADIERAWALQAVPQGAARRRETADLAACLSAHGVRTEGSGVGAVLAAAGAASGGVAECIDRHAVLFGL